MLSELGDSSVCPLHRSVSATINPDTVQEYILRKKSDFPMLCLFNSESQKNCQSDTSQV